MPFKTIEASLQKAIVLILIALATSLVANGEVMPEGGAMEPMGAARGLTSINGHVKTSFNVTDVHEEKAMNIGELTLMLEDFKTCNRRNSMMVKEGTPFSSGGFDTSFFSEWVTDLLAANPKTKGPVIDNVLGILTQYRGPTYKVAEFLTSASNPDHHEVYALLSDRLLHQFIEAGLTPRQAFERLCLPDNEVSKVFDDPIMVMWKKYVETYVRKLKPSSNALSEMLAVLSIYKWSFSSLVKAMRHSVSTYEWKSPWRKLYVQQLINLCNYRPNVVANMLGLSIEDPFRDRAALFIFVDYLNGYINRVEGIVDPTEEQVLAHFFEIFEYHNTVKLAGLFKDK